MSSSVFFSIATTWSTSYKSIVRRDGDIGCKAGPGGMMSGMRRFGELKCDGGLTGARRGLILVQLDPRNSNPAYGLQNCDAEAAHMVGMSPPDICYLLPAGRRRLADTLDRLDLL
jgi:hypothetical protein